MATNRWTFVAAIALILASAGCGNSGSTAHVMNPAPPPAQGVSIAFQSAPPSGVVVGSTASLTAVVTNDSTNGGMGSGIDWSLTCGNPTNCGTLSAPHTNSGQAVTYFPPPTLTGNTEVVSISAFATADHSQNVLTSITVSAFGSSLMGTYVLEVQGSLNAAPYQVVASIVLDGNGNVTSGEQTFNFVDGSGNFDSQSGSVGTGSTYFLGPDGRGTLTINPGAGNSVIGPETFTLAYLSNAHLLIAANQNANSPGVVSASGTMDLQAGTGIAALSGGYAFVTQGTCVGQASGPVAIGGVLNVDNQLNNPNNISGVGSLSDENVGAILYPAIGTSGSVSTPDSFGRVNITLIFNDAVFLGFNNQFLCSNLNTTIPTPSINLQGYMVDATHMKLIENDPGGLGFVAGQAIGQAFAPGTFSDSTFAGTYVFGLLGVDPIDNAPDTVTAAGVMTVDGAGSITGGYADSAFQAATSPITALPAEISGSFDGSYNSSFAGTGRFATFMTHFPSPSGLYYQPELIFYLTGCGTPLSGCGSTPTGGSPALVLGSANTASVTYATYPFPFFATGMAYPQATGPLTLSGNYGMYFTQQNGTESDGTAEMNATSSAFSAVTDVGSLTDQAFAGTISSQSCSPTVSGCFSGSFSNSSGSTGLVGSNSVNAAIAFGADFYMIDPTQGFFVETDLLQQNAPLPVSFGYFAAASLPSQPAAAKAKAKTKPRK